jgi:hypothetical protein
VKRRAPRLWGTTQPTSILLIFLSLTLLFGWGNIRVQKGSILEGDAILQPADAARAMDHYVTNRLREGFEGREMIPFILTFPEGIGTTADLQKIWRFSQEVKAAFGNHVLSLAEVPDYRDTGERLLDEPYITPALFSDEQFDNTQLVTTLHAAGKCWRPPPVFNRALFRTLLYYAVTQNFRRS